MTDHVFISYPTADELNFARKLTGELEGGKDKFIGAWSVNATSTLPEIGTIRS